VVVYSAPDDVSAIFALSGDVLRAGEALEPLRWFLGPRSLIVLDGTEHLDERREMLSLFTPRRLARLEDTMPRAAARAVGRWTPGGGLDLWTLVDRTLDEMNLALALGARPEEALRLAGSVRRARRAFAARLLFRPLLRGSLGSWSPDVCMADVRRGLRAAVVRRLEAGEARAEGAETCLLDLLLDGSPAPTEGEIGTALDRLITLLAGMENASAAAAWTCLHLLRTPAALERVRREVRACGEDVVPGPDSFLEAACKESLRLHPPFPVVMRRVARPLRLGGFDLAPDTLVVASLYLMHRRADLFPEPDAFRPERFLDASCGAGAYLPFGTGVRRCLGYAFAARQLRIVLAEMFRRFDIELEGSPRVAAVRRTATLIPAGHVRVTVRSSGWGA
jgi:cytochrome P450